MSAGARRSRLRRELAEAAAFLSPVVPGPASPSPGALALFPVVGAGLGLVTGAVWSGARRVFPALPAAVLAVATDAVLTGALHLDGVADTADGLLAHVPAKDRLMIMAEPGIGSFGTVALIVTLAARVAALATIDPSAMLLASAWGASRSTMAVASTSLPYARSEGLATAFLGDDTERRRARQSGIAGILVAALVARITHGRRGFTGVAAGSAAAAVVLAAARRRIGGFTGDVLGAAGVACETVTLVVVAQR